MTDKTMTELAAMAQPTIGDALRVELSGLLNRYSAENASNTPDYILAKYMMACLMAYSEAVNDRDKWYGVDLRPGRST